MHIFALTILALAFIMPANAETQCKTVCTFSVCKTVCREVYTERDYQRDNYQNELRRLNRENRSYDPSDR
jgi:hypothetical protein